jgi:shikimate dehydrogenase
MPSSLQIFSSRNPERLPVELGLIGRRLGHSFSSNYFTKKFHSLNIRCKYSLFELESLEVFADFPTIYPQVRGLNVTIPYKQAILAYVHALDATAEAVGAANTLLRTNGATWMAYNTDVQGFAFALREFLGAEPCPPAMILGTGGAARAVDYVLTTEFGQADRLFVSRNPIATHEIPWTALEADMLKTYRLVINCTPLGTYPDVDSAPPLPYAALTGDHWLFDLVYNPAETQFLARGRAAGAHTCNGLGMLYAQAEAAWAIWNQALHIAPPP